MPDTRVPSADIAIVGMAALFPGAADLDAYWRNIVGGVDALSDVPDSRWDASYYDPTAWSHPASDRFYCRRGGFLDGLADFDPAAFGIMPVAVEGTEPDQLLALKVAAAAIADAGGEDHLGDRGRVGVILGRGGYLSAGGARLDQRVRAGRQLVASLRELVPGLSGEQLDRVARDFQNRLGPEHPESSIGLVPNLAASRIANRLDLQGPAYTVDAACASSLLAVDQAAGELARGRCDVVIAGGIHVCDDVTLWSVFSQLRALSPSQQIRPFDRRADGLLIGEGTGMVILKRLADAEAAGDRIYAVIRGTGVASDGRDASLMRPRVAGQVLALERAWATAGLDPAAPGAVGLVEAHGTATPVGDEAELTTLRQVFGSDGPAIALGSVKSMIGHTMPAAGMAGLIKAALAVHHRVLPPTLHCDEPHPSLAGSRFRPQTAAAPWNEQGAGLPRRAAVNAFGFGGINAHVILEEAPGRRPETVGGVFTPPGHSVRRVQPVLLMAGASAQDLSRQLAGDDAALLARDDLHRVPTGGPWRLAIVDPNPTRLELARKVVARGRPWRGRNDVWFTSAPLLAGDDAKVAFVFPGVEHIFEPRVEGVAGRFGLPEPDLSATGNVGGRSVATIAVSRLLDAALRRLGITPDVLAGHSIGEWSAMIAAGMHDGADIDRVLAAFDQDSMDVDGLVFAALGCGADLAEAAITGLPRIEVTHDNCPHQSIICGAETSVATALERLRAEGVGGQVLSFRSGFHSSMVEPFLAPLGHLLADLPLRAAGAEIWSATVVGPYPEDLDEVRRVSVRHLLERVRFGPMVRRLYASGVRAFVQVGAGSLTGFIDDTLRDQDQLVISACTSKNFGLDQLLRVAAALWVEGRAPALSELSPRPARPGRARTGHISLRLGTPLVHFGEGIEPLVVAGAGSLPGLHAESANSPVLREFQALLADTESVAGDVLRSWQTPPAARPVPVPAPAPAAAPAAGAAPAAAPTRATTTQVVSVETMPYLLDHCFYRQPDGWPEVSDRFPVVPMTTMLEMMMDAARPLAGGRAIVGLAKVRALRWLAPTEPVRLQVVAEIDPDGNIDVSLEGYARGKVLVAGGFPAAPSPRDECLAGERPSPVSAPDLYGQRWLFHGPQFQGVTEIDAYADNGIRGQLRGLAAPGGLLDNAGQLMGFWIRTTVPANKLAFPATIERLELFGPHPAVGVPVGCTVWIRSVTETNVTADLELRLADGTLWARISGWTDRRFLTDDAVDPTLRWPERHKIAEEQPGGWLLLRDRWHDPANRELVMRRYLAAAERRTYDQQHPRGRHRWLLGRMVAKDAARQWLWQGGAGDLYPAEFEVANEESGRPTISGLPEGSAVSIAHSGECAVAMVGDAGLVGIDIEAIEVRGPQFEATAFTEGERRLLDRLAPAGSGARAEWITRLWTAKEAVAKAVGTGLEGRPHQFEIVAADKTRLRVTARRHENQWWVDTTIVDGPDGAKQYAVGWTTTPVSPAMAAAAAGRGLFQPLNPLNRERTTDNGR
ncbi:MAG: beta-ketoacyl synthase N-terminal-like domain-containing protein [Acidimicrobiales bacterium]